jgi:hypothetical protein
VLPRAPTAQSMMSQPPLLNSCRCITVSPMTSRTGATAGPHRCEAQGLVPWSRPGVSSRNLAYGSHLGISFCTRVPKRYWGYKGVLGNNWVLGFPETQRTGKRNGVHKRKPSETIPYFELLQGPKRAAGVWKDICVTISCKLSCCLLYWPLLSLFLFY